MSKFIRNRNKISIKLPIVLIGAFLVFNIMLIGTSQVHAVALETCGDGSFIPDDGEECDDGNTIDGDGCSASCEIEYCGDSVINNSNETCDDGNDDDTDNCPSNCKDATCGDGYLLIGSEICDDGNTGEGDGCSSSCTYDQLWVDDENDCGSHTYCYDNITNAINDIDENGTVNVLAGTYNECVNIDKSIKLIGEDKTSTIINANLNCEYIFNFAEDNIEISNFTLEGDVSIAILTDFRIDNPKINNIIIDNLNEQAMSISATNGEISNSIIRGSCSGIYLVNSDNFNISNNLLELNVLNDECDAEEDILAAINLEESSNITIINNEIKNNTIGIKIFDGCSSSSNIKIYKNIISGNTDNTSQVDGYGVLSECDADNITAYLNYWGNKSSPSGEGPGSGDSVSEHIIYSPWYGNDSFTYIGGEPIINSNGQGEFILPESNTMTISEIVVNIPSGVKITALSNWDGIINPPTIKENATIKPSRNKFTTTISSVIEIGSQDTTLNFDKAVRILIPNEASKLVGYVDSSGNFIEIITVCTFDSQDWADSNLATDGECKIDDNNNLVIWTKHFTEFVSYSQSQNPISSNGNIIEKPITPRRIEANNVPLNISEEQEGSLIRNFSSGDKLDIKVPKKAVKTKTIFTASMGYLREKYFGNFGIGAYMIGNKYFEINAKDEFGEEVTNFSKELEIIIIIHELIDYLDEIRLYFFNTNKNEWNRVQEIDFDNTNGEIKFTINHLTRFAISNITPEDIILDANNTNATQALEQENEIQVLGIKNFIDETLVRDRLKRIYLLKDQFKHHIKTLNELRNRYPGQNIIDVQDEHIQNYKVIVDLFEFANNSLIRGKDMKVYLVNNGKKYHLRDKEELMPYVGQAIQYATQAELKSLVLQSDLKF